MSETGEQPGPRPAAGHRWRPWLAALVLALLCAAIAVVLPHVHAVSARARDAAAASAGHVAVPTDDQKAVLAGATEAANLLTYSRKSFDADWNRALDGATGTLRSEHSKRRDDVDQLLTKGKIDWKAQVEQSALESVADNGSVLVLVTVNPYTVDDKGNRSVPATQRLELTMVKSGDRWLASNLTQVGIQ